eukprot:6349175-Amphidinium_carterae.2
MPTGPERGRSKPGGASRRSKSFGKVLPRKTKGRSIEQVIHLPTKGASSSAAAAVGKAGSEEMLAAQAKVQAAERAWRELNMCASVEVSEQQACIQRMREELERAHYEHIQAQWRAGTAEQGAMQSIRERALAEENAGAKIRHVEQSAVRERALAEENAGTAIRHVEQSAVRERARSEQAAGLVMQQVEHKAAREHERALQGLAAEAEREMTNRIAAQMTEAERMRELSNRECMEAKRALENQDARHAQELEQIRGAARMHVTHELEMIKVKHAHEISAMNKQLEETRQQMMALQISLEGRRPTSDGGDSSNGRWRRTAGRGGGPPPADPAGIVNIHGVTLSRGDNVYETGAGGDPGGGGGGGTILTNEHHNEARRPHNVCGSMFPAAHAPPPPPPPPPSTFGGNDNERHERRHRGWHGDGGGGGGGEPGEPGGGTWHATHDPRSARKEALSINLQPLPTASQFRSWKLGALREIAAASTCPEDCFKWVLQCEQDIPDIILQRMDGYPTIDAKLVRLSNSTPQGLRSFWTSWRWIEEGLSTDIGDQVKCSLLYEQVKDYGPLAAELLPYKLADAGDPCRSYGYLTKVVARRAERELQENTRKQVIAGIRDLAGGQDRAFPASSEEIDRGGAEPADEAHLAQAAGSANNVCWLWQETGAC